MVQRFDVGTRLSEMAVHNGVCYLAGQVAADGTQDIAGQTRRCWPPSTRCWRAPAPTRARS